MAEQKLLPPAAFRSMIMAGLLNPEHEAVRSNTYKFGERIAQSGQGHLHLLEMLSHLGTADYFPHHCAEYYRLLTEVIRTIAAMPAQVTPESSPLRLHNQDVAKQTGRKPSTPSHCKAMILIHDWDLTTCGKIDLVNVYAQTQGLSLGTNFLQCYCISQACRHPAQTTLA